MIHTTDGKTFVFGLFGADGCECENLEALFATEEAARERMAEIQAGAELHTRTTRPYKTGDCYGNPDFLDVRMIEVRG